MPVSRQYPPVNRYLVRDAICLKCATASLAIIIGLCYVGNWRDHFLVATYEHVFKRDPYQSLQHHWSRLHQTCKVSAVEIKEGTADVHRDIFLQLDPCSILGIATRPGNGRIYRKPQPLIARRGRLTKIYSDNGRTFIAAANWLKKVREDERLNTFLSTHKITWQFNLRHATWWGGQFVRLIGVMKGAFYKTVGQGQLSWDELIEVPLGIEIVLNNRPLNYAEDDIQLPTLTPNALLFKKFNILPELQSYHLIEKDLRKRAKFLQRSKDAIWCRWCSEYQ